jgi:hypothetical protein
MAGKEGEMSSMFTTRIGAVGAALALLVAQPVGAGAQPSAGRGQAASLPDLRAGQMVWVTTTSGREHGGRVVPGLPAELLIAEPGGERRFDPAEIGIIEMAVRDNVRDGVRNGALVGGAGMGAFISVVAVLVCSVDGCSGDAAQLIFAWTGLGAGAGVLLGGVVDASTPTRRVVHPTARATAIHGVTAGQVVWITTTDGRTVEGKVLAASRSAIDLAARNTRQSFPMSEVRTIEARRRDGLGNGFRNGAIAGAAGMAGALVIGQASNGACCQADTTWLWTGMGAGVGALAGGGLDALLHAREVLYPARPDTPVSVSIAPMIRPRGAGLGVSIRW